MDRSGGWQAGRDIFFIFILSPCPTRANKKVENGTPVPVSSDSNKKYTLRMPTWAATRVWHVLAKKASKVPKYGDSKSYYLH